MTAVPVTSLPSLASPEPCYGCDECRFSLVSQPGWQWLRYLLPQDTEGQSQLTLENAIPRRRSTPTFSRGQDPLRPSMLRRTCPLTFQIRVHEPASKHAREAHVMTRLVCIAGKLLLAGTFIAFAADDSSAQPPTICGQPFDGDLAALADRI